MTQRLIDQIISELQKNKFVAKAESDNRGYVEVNRDQITDVATTLKNLGFDHVKSVTGIDFPDQHKIQIIYHISSYENLELAKIIFAIRTYVTYEDPKIKSLTGIWDSAWTGERETYEMLGVVFDGHPDLKRLFLPEDFEGVYPLRKDFKIKLEGLFVDKS
ncbi:NADH-quinone oxidoreductase subunit C [Acidianus manzaensis]|uniref:NADH-quinone oxidoreductase subunit C n=1 Tax=Acidianus manzaensis TaxID=282676 RepID=A0A1W6K1L9_9CREN|nr:NADH-quinone oxidoreductase subunit C [Acidianus manzaensis]ARM76334.1 NADH-quinone oxidoreductase subunit C [Acidianus manzaensis]